MRIQYAVAAHTYEPSTVRREAPVGEAAANAGIR